jgi:Zn finger protein HypA/HybF involved in hydrogenase expression
MMDLGIPEPFPFEDEGFSAEQMQKVNAALQNCSCKKCYSRGTLQLWSPACGCPKCGRKRSFVASDVFILAD